MTFCCLFRIEREPQPADMPLPANVQCSLVLLADSLAATINATTIQVGGNNHFMLFILVSSELINNYFNNRFQLWDLRYRVALREVSIEKQPSTLSQITGLLRLDSLSLICYKDSNLYKICFPMIKLE